MLNANEIGGNAVAGQAMTSATSKLLLPAPHLDSSWSWNDVAGEPEPAKAGAKQAGVAVPPRTELPASPSIQSSAQADAGGQERVDAHISFSPGTSSPQGDESGQSLAATQRPHAALTSSASDGGSDDQNPSVIHGFPVIGETPVRKGSRGKKVNDRLATVLALPSSLNPIASDGDAGGQKLADAQRKYAPGALSLHAQTIADLKSLQQQRRLLIRSVNRLRNTAGAFIRSRCGWVTQDPAHYPEGTDMALIIKSNKSIVERGARIMKAVETNAVDSLSAEDAKFVNGDVINVVRSYLAMMAPGQAALERTVDVEGKKRKARVGIEPEMERLAKLLPVWPWVEKTYGASALVLAKVIGEAGDLSNYPRSGEPMDGGPGKLWKRLGLAVIDGNRQGNPGKEASADDWVKHGYVRERRSEMWNIGNGLIGCMGLGPRPLVGETSEQIEARSDWSPYQKLFVMRLIYEAERDPSHARPPTKEGKQSFSKHAAARAKRYVEKRFLRDLWRVWRDA